MNIYIRYGLGIMSVYLRECKHVQKRVKYMFKNVYHSTFHNNQTHGHNLSAHQL